MNRRIPPDAFDFYTGLGITRSYQAVAEKYGVSKRAVTACAAREEWPVRLKRVEKEAREQSDKKLTETLQEMRERHLVTVRAMQSRALAALKQYPLSSGMEAMRAAEMAVKLERLVAGEPTEHTASTIEEVIKREYEEWMVHDEAVEGRSLS